MDSYGFTSLIVVKEYQMTTATVTKRNHPSKTRIKMKIGAKMSTVTVVFKFIFHSSSQSKEESEERNNLCR